MKQITQQPEPAVIPAWAREWWQSTPSDRTIHRKFAKVKTPSMFGDDPFERAPEPTLFDERNAP